MPRMQRRFGNRLIAEEVASPLLSILYMNRFLKHWRLTGRGEAFGAQIVADATTSSSSAAERTIFATIG
jgi:hypothetical protein